MNVVQLGRMMQIMGLILTVKPENKNVSYTIPLSSDFIEFIGLQTVMLPIFQGRHYVEAVKK